MNLVLLRHTPSALLFMEAGLCLLFCGLLVYF